MHRIDFSSWPEAALGNLEFWESRFDTQIAGLERTLIQIRRHLHAHPEPSGEEVETSRYIAQRLQEAELTPRICRDGLGVVADLTIGDPTPQTPLIAIRADIDALRTPDEKTVEYKSQNPGVNHACGHDVHSSIVLGAALAGAALAFPVQDDQSRQQDHVVVDTFPIRLRVLFQPAEETSVGANWLVEQGALDGVAAIIALHVDPERLVGQVGLRYGVLTANCEEVDIQVDGRGGHAARPHHTVDPIAASAQLISALYQSLPRSIDSRIPSVFSIGQISGGYAPNVIPERVELRGTFRTTDVQSHEILKRRFAEIVDGVRDISGAQIHVRFHTPLKSVHNDPQVAEALEEAARRVVGQDNITIIDRPSMGGEDFSVYLDHVPGAMMRLGCAAPGGEHPFLHSSMFDVDEHALTLGTRILIRAALLLSVGLRSDVSED